MNKELIALLEAALMVAKADVAAPATATTPAPAVVPDGMVLLPVTQHILRLPVAAQTSFWGYMIDEAERAGGAAGNRGPMQAGRALAWAGVSADDRQRWPYALDRYYNLDAYDPAGKAARDEEGTVAASAPFISHPSAPKTPAPSGVVDVPIG